MNATTPIVRLHEHRMWANENLRQACLSLTSEQLHQQHAIGQGTLWKTLCHMYAAEYVWLEALQGKVETLCPGDVPGKLPGNQEGEGAVTTSAELFDRWKRLDQLWNAYLTTLTPDLLSVTIYKKSSSSFQGQAIGVSAMDVLLHVATHAHYTTAQAINMLRHVGVETLPQSMLITLARAQSLEQS
ncbi:DinB family protein [Bremerella sp. JC817]|uniref:DinB family protein n=1 Tax=Bremerella sp. JC817 TaxID=3231756 RepID=UPI00345B1C89